MLMDILFLVIYGGGEFLLDECELLEMVFFFLFLFFDFEFLDDILGKYWNVVLFEYLGLVILNVFNKLFLYIVFVSVGISWMCIIL